MSSPTDPQDPNQNQNPVPAPTPAQNQDPTQSQTPAQNQAPAENQTPTPNPNVDQQPRPKLKRVNKKFDIRSGARTKAANVTVEPSGRAAAGVKATRMSDAMAAEAGFDVQRYHTYFEADEELGIVGAYVCSSLEPGAMPVRRSVDGRTVSFHLGAVFEIYPALRPSGKTNCSVERVIDQNGKPYLQISLGTGLAHRKRNQSNGTTKAKKQTESETEIPGEFEEELEDEV